MRLVFAKPAIDLLRNSLEALHEGHRGRLRALLARGADSEEVLRLRATAEDELRDAAFAFACAASVEEARRIRALQTLVGCGRIDHRRFRQGTLEVEAWADGIAEQAEALCEALGARLDAALPAAPHAA